MQKSLYHLRPKQDYKVRNLPSIYKIQDTIRSGCLRFFSTYQYRPNRGDGINLRVHFFFI